MPTTAWRGLRVTSITDVQRRSNGLRVSGTAGLGRLRQRGYGYQGQGYQQAYAASSLSFRCNVDYNGVGHRRSHPPGQRLSRLTGMGAVITAAPVSSTPDTAPARSPWPLRGPR